MDKNKFLNLFIKNQTNHLEPPIQSRIANLAHSGFRSVHWLVERTLHAHWLLHRMHERLLGCLDGNWLLRGMLIANWLLNGMLVAHWLLLVQ